RDVTDRRQAEERINRLNEELEQRVRSRTQQLEAANREKDDLLARERAARQETEVAERRLAFLAEASSVLAGSLDYKATLTNLARLAVPQLADWCVVHIVEEDGSVRPLAVTHVHPEKEAYAWELCRRYPVNPAAEEGVAK